MDLHGIASRVPEPLAGYEQGASPTETSASVMMFIALGRRPCRLSSSSRVLRSSARREPNGRESPAMPPSDPATDVPKAVRHSSAKDRGHRSGGLSCCRSSSSRRRVRRRHASADELPVACGMRTLRAKLAERVRRWRVARAQLRPARDAARGQAAADELQRAREGTNRFPPSGI
jgi:hypothetical protein